VQIYNRIIPGVPCVFTDSYGAGEFGVRYLIERGHRRIAHLTTTGYRDEETPGFHGELKKRAEGYAQAMRSAGLEPLIFTVDDTVMLREGGYQIAKTVMGHPYRPTAVTTYSDSLAMGLMKGLTEAGVRVPEDISLIGGRKAARMCLDMIAGRSVEDVTCRARFHAGLTVRTLT